MKDTMTSYKGIETAVMEADINVPVVPSVDPHVGSSGTPFDQFFFFWGGGGTKTNKQTKNPSLFTPCSNVYYNKVVGHIIIVNDFFA